MTFPNGGQRDEHNPARKVTSERWDAYKAAGNSAVDRIPPDLRERVGERARSHAENLNALGLPQNAHGGVGRYLGSLGEGSGQSAYISPESTGGHASDSLEVNHINSDWKNHLLGHAVAYVPREGERTIDKGVQMYRLSDFSPESREQHFGHLPGYAAFSTPESIERRKPEIG